MPVARYSSRSVSTSLILAANRIVALINTLIGSYSNTSSNEIFITRFCHRFLNCGWHGAKAWDMVQVYQSLPSNEIQRIEKLELLDEAELLTQLFQHYCISIAWTGDLFEDIEIT